MRCLAWAALLCACSGDPSDRPATWSYVDGAIIAPNCTTSSCHSDRTAVADVPLEDRDDAYDVLVSR